MGLASRQPFKDSRDGKTVLRDTVGILGKGNGPDERAVGVEITECCSRLPKSVSYRSSNISERPKGKEERYLET